MFNWSVARPAHCCTFMGKQELCSQYGPPVRAIIHVLRSLQHKYSKPSLHKTFESLGRPPKILSSSRLALGSSQSPRLPPKFCPLERARTRVFTALVKWDTWKFINNVKDRLMEYPNTYLEIVPKVPNTFSGFSPQHLPMALQSVPDNTAKVTAFFTPRWSTRLSMKFSSSFITLVHPFALIQLSAIYHWAKWTTIGQHKQASLVACESP